jgi:uncharacterized protein (DUF58 family)
VRLRSSWAIALGLLGLIAAWAFGTTPLAVIGIGLCLAGLAARAWARVARDAVALEHRVLPGERSEGCDVAVEVKVHHHRRLLGGTIVLRQRLGATEQELRLLGSRTVITFTGIPRGRHGLGPLEATLHDALGLERVEHRLERGLEILVRPQVPALSSVFSTRGARDSSAARAAVRRPTGFEIHAVRDYVPGEPLRAVHWPSTARRGRLIVKELDDAPREDLALVLDQDAAGVAGPPGSTSFDAAVRAVGALALAHLRWGRRIALLGTAPGFAPVLADSTGHDWEVMLDALAGVEPAENAALDVLLRPPAGHLSRARELVVVTARPERATDALLELRRGGRAVSLVVVASETFAGRPRDQARPAVLRAAAAGVPVAVVTADGTIEQALSGSVGGTMLRA